MVNTRTNSITPVPTMESLQESIIELRNAIVEIKDGITGFLVNQNALSQEVNRLKTL